MKNSTFTSLKGHILISMPDLGDPRFDKTVLLVCNHDETGTMALIVNKALGSVDVSDILKQDRTDKNETMADPISQNKIPIYYGGPVETEKGLIIHTPDFTCEDSITLSKDIAVTGTLDILKTIRDGQGPKDFLFTLGYAGWAAGQLEEELAQNAWLNSPVEAGLIFETPLETRWNKALAGLGVTPEMLTSQTGRA